MGSLNTTGGNIRELLTEELSKAQWWNAIELIVTFMTAKGVARVAVEFGFVSDLDVAGRDQGINQTVELKELKVFIEEGLNEGTIEFKAGSDSVFHAEDKSISVMLCNDSDIHFAAKNFSTTLELAQNIKSIGIKVYDSGKQI